MWRGKIDQVKNLLSKSYTLVQVVRIPLSSPSCLSGKLKVKPSGSLKYITTILNKGDNIQMKLEYKKKIKKPFILFL